MDIRNSLVTSKGGGTREPLVTRGKTDIIKRRRPVKYNYLRMSKTRKHRLKKVKRITKVISRYNIEYSHEVKNTDL